MASFDQLRPGQRLSAADTNRLTDAVTQMGLSAGGDDISVVPTAGGLSVTNSRPRDITIRITGAPTGIAHPWQQVDETDPTTFPDYDAPGFGMTGDVALFPAYDVNLSTADLTGTKVRAWLAPTGDAVLFDASGCCGWCTDYYDAIGWNVYPYVWDSVDVAFDLTGASEGGGAGLLLAETEVVIPAGTGIVWVSGQITGTMSPTTLEEPDGSPEGAVLMTAAIWTNVGGMGWSNGRMGGGVTVVCGQWDVTALQSFFGDLTLDGAFGSSATFTRSATAGFGLNVTTDEVRLRWYAFAGTPRASTEMRAVTASVLGIGGGLTFITWEKKCCGAECVPDVPGSPPPPSPPPSPPPFVQSLKVPATKTANYSVELFVDGVKGDASGGAFTVTLPDAAAINGRKVSVKKTDSSANAVSVAAMTGAVLDSVRGGSGAADQTIDGSTTPIAITTQWLSLTFESDGTNWIII